METLKIFGLILLFGLVYGFVSNNDYHKMFATETLIRYNCNRVLSSWVQEAPPEVFEECKLGEKEYVYVKTFKE
jgi:hypothetical protein